MNFVQSEGAPTFTSVTECSTLPEYWNDEERMNVLLGPFRNRDLNPTGYDKKLLYWENNIDFYCECNKRCSFTLRQLKAFFTRKNIIPYCLQTVLQHMVREKAIQDVSDFMKPVSGASWLWNTPLLTSPINWFKEYAFPIEISEINEEQEFIYKKTLERNGKLLISVIRDDGGHDKLYQYTELSKLSNMSKPTIKLIVRWLVLEKRAYIMEPLNEVPALNDTLIKFSVDNSNVSPITADKANVFVLHEKEKEFLEIVDNLEKEKEIVTEETRSYLKQGKRQLAKSSLRKKKEIEKRIEKRIVVLDNIRSLLFTIEEAKSGAEVLSTHQGFLNLLKKYNEDVNLTNVENVMDKVTEEFDRHDDIQTILSTPIDVRSPNESEFESELAELLLKDIPDVPPSPPNGNQKRKINVDDLPDVPEDKPTAAYSNTPASQLGRAE